MKEKIDQLSKEVFIYQPARMILSDEKFTICAEAGKTAGGRVHLSNSKGVRMKGVVYGTGCLLKVLTPQFASVEEFDLRFTFDATHLEAGEKETGVIWIISDLGEIDVPYEAIAESPYYLTSLGKISDLFQFTNLVKSSPEEAVKIFVDKNFDLIFLEGDAQNRLIYRSLVKSKDSFGAMEEFLVAIHKKTPVRLSIPVERIECSIGKKTMMEQVTAVKSNWGYTKIKVYSDAPFLKPECDTVSDDKCSGSHIKVPFLLKPELMKNGRNEGHIYLKTPQQLLSMDIVAFCGKEKKGSLIAEWKRKSYEAKIFRLYLNYRTGRITQEQFITSARTNLYAMDVLEKTSEQRIFGAYLYWIEGKEKEVRKILDEFGMQLEESRQKHPAAYCMSVLLNAALSKNSVVRTEAVTIFHTYAQKYPDDWWYIWFHLQLKEKSNRNYQKRLEELQCLFQNGSRSPILYLEAALVYKAEPQRLRNLDEFEIQVMNWAARQGIVTKDMAGHYALLTGKLKKHRKLMFYTLGRCYEKVRSKEALATLCSGLIKAHKTNSRYFKWYRAGVEAQLKITELHEYFMYSYPEQEIERLPQQILLYFMFDNHLNDTKRAYLYASVVQYKEENYSIYHSYQKQIREFVESKLLEGTINEYLAILYEDLAEELLNSESTARAFANILFLHGINCENRDMNRVVVVHNEIKGEEEEILLDGKAQVSIFTETARIFLEDIEGNRYLSSIPYQMRRFLDVDRYVEQCYEATPEEPKVLFHIAERVSRYHKKRNETLEFKKRVLAVPNLNPELYKIQMKELVQYYYDNFEGEQLEECLLRLKLETMRSRERADTIELFILRGLYGQAIEALEEYGFIGISIGRLMKLCHRIFTREGKEGKEEFLLKLCQYLFSFGKYNEDMVRFLIEKAEGSLRFLLSIWENGQEMKIETTKLEERLLAQALFSENMDIQIYPVFYSYFRSGENKVLIQAFFSYSCYKYLTADRQIPEELFENIKESTDYREHMIYQLSLLKYYSEKEKLSQEELEFSEYYLRKLYEQEIIFSFYANFTEKFMLPGCLNHKYFVQYHTDPSNQVTIYYRIERKGSEEGFMAEPMKHMYLGIYVKEFLLFYDEELQYYITEIEDGEEHIVESVQIQPDNQRIMEEDSRYDRLNLMLMSQEMQDEKTMKDLMEQKVVLDYMANYLFEPL